MKNLVMGFATNLNEHSFRVFVKSLRRVYSPDECDLVIITNEFKPYFMDLSALGATFVPTPNNYSNETGRVSKIINRTVLNSMRGLRRLNVLERIAPEIADTYNSLIEKWHHPHFVRWFAYENFLRLNRAYDQVFLSDVKDVVFQAPFFSPLTKVLLFDQNEKYGESYFETKWYRDAFGKKALEKIRGRTAICIGTILGPHAGILGLVEEIRDYFSHHPFGCIEQAAFNYLIANDLIKTSFDIIPYDTGPVANLPGKDYVKIFVEDGLIKYQESRETIPIVHMYDRIAEPRATYAGW